MNRIERRGAGVPLAALIGLFAFLTLLVAVTSGRSSEEWIVPVVNAAMLVTPAIVAAAVLWWAWRTRAGARRPVDAPERLLIAAVATLPADRADWGAAMTAELAQVRDRRARWGFAAGCARTAILPPRANRMAVFVVGTLATIVAVVSGLVAGRTLPGTGVFAMTFVALVGAMLTVGASRSSRILRPTSSPTMATAGAVGVAACLGAIGYMVSAFPTAAEALRPSYAVQLAVVLAGVLWITLSPPRLLASSRLARVVGTGAAAALGAGLFLDARLPDGSSGVMDFMVFAPIAILFFVSVVVAAVRRSFRVGLQAAVWASVQAGMLLFAVWVIEAVRWYRIDGTLLMDRDGAPVGANLADAFFWVLVFVPLWALPFGIFGAALGSARWRRGRGRRDAEPQPAR